MPSTSAKQHRAMEAAAHGRSTLGIPKKVGKEFAAADAAKPHPQAKHMAERKSAGMTHAQVGREFGVSKSTAHRKQAGLVPARPVTTGQAAGSMGSTKGAQPMFSDGFMKMGSARK